MSRERNLFSARLFPALILGTAPNNSACAFTQIGMALWLAGQPPEAVETQDICFIWRSSCRLSLHDILKHTDFEGRIDDFKYVNS